MFGKFAQVRNQMVVLGVGLQNSDEIGDWLSLNILPSLKIPRAETDSGVQGWTFDDLFEIQDCFSDSKLYQDPRVNKGFDLIPVFPEEVNSTFAAFVPCINSLEPRALCCVLRFCIPYVQRLMPKLSQGACIPTL
jgi:hypothetical protein